MRKTSTDGFTLIELLVVIVITGILAAIAAPGWLAFVNRQRVNSVRDEMLQIVQSAQSDARRTNSGYEVNVNSTVGLASLTVAKDITPGASDIATGLKTDLGSEQIKDKLKIKAKDTNGVDVDAIMFDHRGQIGYVNAPSITGEGTLPVVFYAELDGIDVPKRCIVFTTLLGGMVTGEGEDCDNINYVPVP